MAVKIRPYRGDTTGKAWEADIQVTVASTGERIRKRLRCPVSSRSGSRRWAEQYARTLMLDGDQDFIEIQPDRARILRQSNHPEAGWYDLFFLTDRRKKHYTIF